MMGKIHKILVGLSMLLFLFTAYGMIALVTTESVHGQTVTQVVYSGNGTITVNGDYQLSSDFTGTITIGNAVTDVKIIGNGSEHQHTNTNISVAGDRTVALNLTIEDLNIAAATGAWPDPGDHGIDFGDAGNFQHNLYISGRSTIGGGSSKAGIHVPNDIALTINLAAGETQGEILVSSQGAGAGIGGGSEGAGGTITIAGGTVTAKGGFGGAGIGGGFEGAGGTITITGGTVTATSYYGAGIGSGSHGAGGTITITGGEVTATGNEGGAGIGGGHNGLHGIITITGGTVTATGGRSDYRGGAGIGGGGIYNNSGSGGTITITGGTVIAKSGEIWGGSTSADRFGGAGIGGGGNGSGGVITIEGGEVEATGGDEYVRGHGGAGIGGGSNESGGIITIAGGTVSATGGSGGAGIGSGGIHIGNSGSGGTITITGGNVIAKGGGYGAANIGGGKNGEGGIVYIKGENTNVVATGNDGWDIGSGSNNDNGGSLSVGEGATVDITSTNAEIDKKLILRNFTVSPETDATTLDTVVLAVNVDGIIFSIFQEIHQGVISFKANGEEIERAEIIAEGSSTRGTASINVCNLPDGTYTFLAEYVEGEGNGFHAENPLQITNYSISKTNQDSLIMHIPPTITYGDDSFDIEVRGGSGTGAISYQVTSGNAITVGETGRVTIVASGDAEVNVTKAGDQHYHEAEAIVSITVTPKPLTITADDKSKLQGETDPEFTVTYTGFIEGEDTSNLEGELVLNREEGEEAGTYIITPSGLTSTNYSITFETGILRIINTSPDLSSLTLSSGGLNPTFSPGETSYTASVTNSVSSITVTPEAEDNHAIIKVNNQTVTSGQASEAIALKVGANTITVEVTAEDGVTI
ncbi:Cadherin-like beta sandwich domain-containing protein, partial [Natronincola peptidivorans]